MNTRNSILTIVIAHEDLITGIETAVVLERLVTRLKAEFGINSDALQINSGFWKFETLRDPELRQQATTKAVEADIIIISVGGAKLPGCVKNWIESVLPMKEGEPAALVALLDRGHETSGEPPRWAARLRRLAGKCGLDFYCNINSQPTCAESGIESIISRSEGDSAIWRSDSPKLHLAGTGRR